MPGTPTSPAATIAAATAKATSSAQAAVNGDAATLKNNSIQDAEAIESIGEKQKSAAADIQKEEASYITSLDRLGDKAGSAVVGLASDLKEGMAQTSAAAKDISSLSTKIPGLSDILDKQLLGKIGQIGGDEQKLTDTLKASSDALGTDKTLTSDQINKIDDLTKGNPQADTIAELLKSNDPKQVAEGLAKQQDLITKQKMELATQTVTQSQDLAKWYQGIATNYSDIATRYKDAVTGLSDSEKQSMTATAARDSAAMSAVASQGSVNAFRGQTLTTGQQAAFSAVGQQAAAGAYSTAMQRMTDIDQQRREMQFNIVTASGQQQQANMQTGGAINANEIQLAGAARADASNYLQAGQTANASMAYQANADRFSEGITGINTSLAGISQMSSYDMDKANIGLENHNAQINDLMNQSNLFIADTNQKMAGVGMQMNADVTKTSMANQNNNTAIALYNSRMINNQFQEGILNTDNAANMTSITSKLGAATYQDEASIAARSGNFQQSLQMEGLQSAQAAADAQKRANQLGMVLGVAGAVAGGVISETPQGAAAGYAVGSGLGQAAGGGY